MGFELGGVGLRLAVSLATSDWFRWSLRPQPVQTYEVEPLLATRFLIPFLRLCRPGRIDDYCCGLSFLARSSTSGAIAKVASTTLCSSAGASGT